MEESCPLGTVTQGPFMPFSLINIVRYYNNSQKHGTSIYQKTQGLLLCWCLLNIVNHRENLE